MARTNNNALLQNLSGAIDEIVIKQYAFGTVVSKKPDMSKVKKSKLQKAKQGTFKEAVAYAKTVLKDEKLKKKYSKGLKPGQTAFNAAVSAYMKGEVK